MSHVVVLRGTVGRCDSIVQIQPITPELHVQVIVNLSTLINHGIVHVLKCFRLPVSRRGEAAVRVVVG